MPVTINALDNEFAASSGTNIDVTPSYSYFDYPPNSTFNLTITSNMGDEQPFLFEVGETYDLTWDGHGGGIMEDAVIIRSDYVGPGQGAIVFEGTNSVTGEPFQIVWSPGFDLENWYWSNGGGPSNPKAFWTSDQNGAETVQVVCYAPGTLILTERGEVSVELLTIGDCVVTLDNGLQPIRWMRRDVRNLQAAVPDQKPILIGAGALGGGRPAQDLIVSPQHRVLVGGQGQLDTWFRSESLAPAKSLTALPGIRLMRGKQVIEWVHFACKRHEIVVANGCLTESLLLGPEVLNAMSPGDRAVLADIFGPGPMADAALNGPPARGILTVSAARRQFAKKPNDEPDQAGRRAMNAHPTTLLGTALLPL